MDELYVKSSEKPVKHQFVSLRSLLESSDMRRPHETQIYPGNGPNQPTSPVMLGSEVVKDRLEGKQLRL